MEMAWEPFAAAATLLLGVWGLFHRYTRGVKQDIRDVKQDIKDVRQDLKDDIQGTKQDLGGRMDRYEAANRDEHARLGAKLDKQGNALESLKVEVGKLTALRGRDVLDALKERWFPEPDKPPDDQ